MAAELYFPVFIAVISILCCFFAFRFATSPDFRYQEERNGILFAFGMCVVLSLWLGLRPVSVVFGDTVVYATYYEYLRNPSLSDLNLSWTSEWFFNGLLIYCKSLDLDVSVFFTIIEFGYIFTAFFAIKRFVPTNPLLGMLFVFASLMFFTFATNGLRNGLACHMALLGIAYYLDERYLPAIFWAVLAFGTHISVLLPIVSVPLCRFVLRDYRYSVTIWVICIIVSLIYGPYFANFAEILKMNDRVVDYLNGISDEGIFITGFRADFIIYSTPPILLGWYIIIRKKIADGWYTTLSSAYCICNAMWILVIRAAYSNRFAYLSWFMYPVLIVYPLVNLPVWNDQDKRIAIGLLAYLGFTLFMNFVFWA